MNKYAISVICNRDKNMINQIRHSCFIIEVGSKHEAEGLGLAIGRKFWPVSEGWTSHHCVVSTLDNLVTLESARIESMC